MKILILKPSSLGDVVQALPVLRLLKASDASNEIYWWLSSDLLPLLEGDPDLHGIFPFDRRCWVYPRCWLRHLASIRRMRSHRFDWVIDLQGLARSGIFAWLARGEMVIGVDDPREGAGGFYDVAVPRASFHTHAVDWYLEVLRALGVPVHWNFHWLPVRQNVALNLRHKWNSDQARWILVNPGARWATKRWPVEYYQELIGLIAAHYPEYRFAVLGSPAEVNLGLAIEQADPKRCLNLAGRTSLPEMVEWIRLGELMICSDTGPMHIAAALGKPVVAMFGPTEPARTGPYRQTEDAIRVKLPCVPCFSAACANTRSLECLFEITPRAVFEQIQRRHGRILRAARAPKGELGDVLS